MKGWTYDFKIYDIASEERASGHGYRRHAVAKRECYKMIASLAKSYAAGLKLGSVVLTGYGPGTTRSQYRMAPDGTFVRVPR